MQSIMLLELQDLMALIWALVCVRAWITWFLKAAAKTLLWITTSHYQFPFLPAHLPVTISLITPLICSAFGAIDLWSFTGLL